MEKNPLLPTPIPKNGKFQNPFQKRMFNLISLDDISISSSFVILFSTVVMLDDDAEKYIFNQNYVAL